MQTKIRSYLIPFATIIIGLASIATAETNAKPPWVGAYTRCFGGCSTDPAVLWKQKNTAIGGDKLTFSRDFDPTIPAVGKESWREVPSPKHFYSMKPPNGDIDGFIAGKYDSQYRDVIAALPTWTKVTVFHEPEDDMDGQTYFALIKHAYDLAHAVRNDVDVWYVATAYQWETNSKGNVTTPDGWLDAAKYVDHAGIDVYAPNRNFTDIAHQKGFMNWWNRIAVPAGKSTNGHWGIVERGISGSNGEQARIGILNADWAWAKTHQADLFLYWDSGSNGNYYELNRPDEQAAYRAIAAAGRQP